MILYLVFAAAAALYQLLYLVHCIKKRSAKAAFGTALSSAVTLYYCVLLATSL